MCTFQMRTLTWLDWRNIAKFLPAASARRQEIAPQLAEADLRAAIHCLTPDGRVLRGARCIRRLSMRMPLLWPLGIFLWIPGVIQVAEMVYRVVSRNRYLLSRLFGCKEACRLMPAREGRLEPAAQSWTAAPPPGHEKDRAGRF